MIRFLSRVSYIVTCELLGYLLVADVAISTYAGDCFEYGWHNR